jgi:aspartyl protease family protein
VSEEAPHALYLLLLLMLVASSLVGMRLPSGKVVKMALAWVAIFAAGFALFAFRGEFSSLGRRLQAELTGAPIASGSTLRVPVSEDGHFWVDASVNGVRARFLVDSGASVTTVSSALAARAQLQTGMRSAMVETANGTIVMKKSRADRFEVGTIERQDFGVHINAQDSANVLGMNFLSTLASWRVQGNYLVLEP